MNVTDTAVLVEPTEEVEIKLLVEEAVEVRDMFQPGPSDADLYFLLSFEESASTETVTTQ